MKVVGKIKVDELPEHCGLCLFEKELVPHRAKSKYRRVCLILWKDIMPAVREHARLLDCPLEEGEEK